MGQVVFVVEAEQTPQEAVKDALTHLADCNDVGVILNKAPMQNAGGDFYDYGYGYSSYGDYAPQRK
jgi:receptor protein-tyrosine kinase